MNTGFNPPMEYTGGLLCNTIPHIIRHSTECFDSYQLCFKYEKMNAEVLFSITLNEHKKARMSMI